LSLAGGDHAGSDGISLHLLVVLDTMSTSHTYQAISKIEICIYLQEHMEKLLPARVTRNSTKRNRTVVASLPRLLDYHTLRFNRSYLMPIHICGTLFLRAPAITSSLTCCRCVTVRRSCAYPWFSACFSSSMTPPNMSKSSWTFPMRTRQPCPALPRCWTRRLANRLRRI
jgi:hypothetical protein